MTICLKHFQEMIPLSWSLYKLIKCNTLVFTNRIFHFKKWFLLILHTLRGEGGGECHASTNLKGKKNHFVHSILRIFLNKIKRILCLFNYSLIGYKLNYYICPNLKQECHLYKYLGSVISIKPWLKRGWCNLPNIK